LRHANNEDALFVAADDQRGVVVICDGVTTAANSATAAQSAAELAGEHLWDHRPMGLGTPSSRQAATRSVIAQAIALANQAVIDASPTSALNGAASTITLVLIDQTSCHCANLGDSRIYWLPDRGEPVQASRDHSLAQIDIDAGVDRDVAEARPGAHTITKWLGADASDLTPFLANLELTSPGWLLVCSDGLWNYASSAQALKQLIGAGPPDQSASDLVDRLLDWAKQQGGQDNITVACARWPHPLTDDSETTVPRSALAASTDAAPLPDGNGSPTKA
jgi:serine/threonine protein phosphatase PrpC